MTFGSVNFPFGRVMRTLRTCALNSSRRSSACYVGYGVRLASSATGLLDIVNMQPAAVSELTQLRQQAPETTALLRPITSAPFT